MRTPRRCAAAAIMRPSCPPPRTPTVRSTLAALAPSVVAIIVVVELILTSPVTEFGHRRMRGALAALLAASVRRPLPHGSFSPFGRGGR